METKTDNELIAEFMGGKRMTVEPFFGAADVEVYQFEQGNNPNPHANIGTQRRITELDYDKRWDWFMPAFAKFASIETDTTDKMLAEHADHCASIAEKILEVDITAARERLAEGIKWYNSQPQKHGN